jgi:hypothetical protein
MELLKKISGWYRLLIFISTIWILGVLALSKPWSYSRRAGYVNFKNLDDFIVIGLSPVILCWGIIWIVQGFKKDK